MWTKAAFSTAIFVKYVSVYYFDYQNTYSYFLCTRSISQIARFMGPTWGPPGSCQPQVGPMIAPRTWFVDVNLCETAKWPFQILVRSNTNKTNTFASPAEKIMGNSLLPCITLLHFLYSEFHASTCYHVLHVQFQTHHVLLIHNSPTLILCHADKKTFPRWYKESTLKLLNHEINSYHYPW